MRNETYRMVKYAGYSQSKDRLKPIKPHDSKTAAKQDKQSRKRLQSARNRAKDSLTLRWRGDLTKV